MKTPVLKSRKKGKNTKSAFGQYEKNILLDDKALSEAYNISRKYYPALAPRSPRRSLGALGAAGAVSGFCPIKGGDETELRFTGVKGTTFYYKGKAVAVQSVIGVQPTLGEKEILQYGSKLIIAPDMLMFDMDAAEENPDEELKPLIINITCSAVVLPLKTYTYGSALNLSLDLLATSYTPAQQQEILAKYARISNGDSLALYWYTHTSKKSAIVPSVEEIMRDELGDYEGASCVVRGRVDTESTDTRKLLEMRYKSGDTFQFETAPNHFIDIRKVFPVMTSLCAHSNRIYGVNGTKIYASASYNGFSFCAFENKKSDAFAKEIFEGGDFVGVSVHKNKVAAFKKNHMYEFFEGTDGVREGNRYKVGCIDKKSIVSANSGLYFLAEDGVYLYDNKVPQKISKNLDFAFKSGCACASGENYYLLATLEDGSRALLVYHFDTKLWHEEDCGDFVGICAFENRVLAYDAAGNFTEFGGGDEAVEWRATVMPITENTFENKAPNAVAVRAYLKEGSVIDIWQRTDRDDGFTLLGRLEGAHRLTSFYIPFLSKKCDNYQIRLSGKGESKIYSLERRFSSGGVNVL